MTSISNRVWMAYYQRGAETCAFYPSLFPDRRTCVVKQDGRNVSSHVPCPRVLKIRNGYISNIHSKGLLGACMVPVGPGVVVRPRNSMCRLPRRNLMAGTGGFRVPGCGWGCPRRSRFPVVAPALSDDMRLFSA